ncbi:hypothetical protein BWQ96_06511 [Gracilariopsis chorda]|uniref:Uncharacterized protein n=1 Tax=Gracilariopsis chorda TaxID=448386 RepID=A0A2V3INU2_9FLOR|nr:hypothetical protein BWQ96_06511 [Gracilariopsis chorda]|eukprot:PXF43734.1 hypothetical protein BWQ96_06511 [Gracilariopsis chorda]
MFTGDAHVFYQDHIKGKINDHDQAVAAIKARCHGETTQEGIVSTLESLRFEYLVL